MKRGLIVFGILLALFAAGATGFALAQKHESPHTPASLRAAFIHNENEAADNQPLEKDREPYFDRLSALYWEAAEKPLSKPELARAAMNHIQARYYLLRDVAKSAAHVSQAADEAMVRLGLLHAAQNQRIIELLERQNRQTKADTEQPARVATQ